MVQYSGCAQPEPGLGSASSSASAAFAAGRSFALDAAVMSELYVRTLGGTPTLFINDTVSAARA